MKPLLWKESRENLKWVTLPVLLMLAPIALFGAPPLTDEGLLFYVSTVAAGFGAGLGFLQVFFESSGDKRSLLLHRPLGRSQIFLGKVLAGVGLYLLGVGLPFVGGVGLAALPGHTSQPFGWPLVLPWLADVLTGLVYYFAGMLTAQREARWYGSRALGLAAGLCCSTIVWTVPEFWQALVAITVLGGFVAVAAWGSFCAGGAYAPQPRLARVALAVTFLAALTMLCFAGQFWFGVWLGRKTEYVSYPDRHGRVLRVSFEDGEIRDVTDLTGDLPPQLRGKRVGRYEVKAVVADVAHGGTPRTRSYRNRNRYMLEYTNEMKPGVEAWWYVPREGRLLGYDKRSKNFIGSFGPDGFVRPDEPPRGRFRGKPAEFSFMYLAWAHDYLAFPDGVYWVDFSRLTVRTVFVPRDGETVRWAGQWEDEKQRLILAFVGTDQAVYAVDEAGAQVFSAPLAYDPKTYRVRIAGRLEAPERYWVWYEPQWYLPLGTLETLADHVLIYDRSGKEIPPRQDVPPWPGIAHEVVPPIILVEPSVTPVTGAVTPPAEAVVLVGTTTCLESEVRGNHGTEAPLLLRFLYTTTQYLLPGVRWDPRAHAGLVVGFGTLMLFSAAGCAAGCFLLSCRYGFTGARRVGWSVCGLVFGLTGLLLMLVLYDWPARIACPGCGKPRLVTRETCEHCGAPHARPAPDGTEIFEDAAAELQPS